MTRDEVQSLLPFLANDTLTGDERTDVQKFLSDDTELQTELATLRAIRGNMQAEEPDFSPGEIGLARLMRSVDAELVSVPSVATPKPARQPWIWQAAAAVLLAVVIGQAAFQIPGNDLSESNDTFTLASGDTAPDLATGGPLLVIGFAPGVTESQLRALLLDTGLQIAGGPDAQGLYQVTPTEGVTMDAASDALVASDLIEIVELP